MTSESPVRCEIIYRGRVQGVGFRYTTRMTVTNYAVTGYVINLRDGSVRLVLEGARPTVSAAIRSVADAMGSQITDQAESWGAATGEFPTFDIRHERP